MKVSIFSACLPTYLPACPPASFRLTHHAAFVPRSTTIISYHVFLSACTVAKAPATTPNGKEQRAIVFVRTEETTVPTVLLSAVHAENQKKLAAEAVMAATAAAAMGSKGAPIKLMRRNPDDPRAKSFENNQSGGGGEKQVWEGGMGRECEFCIPQVSRFFLCRVAVFDCLGVRSSRVDGWPLSVVIIGRDRKTVNLERPFNC